MSKETNSGVIVKRGDSYSFFRDTGDGLMRTANGHSAADVVDYIRQRNMEPLKMQCSNKMNIIDVSMWAALQHEAIRIVQPVDIDNLWEKVNLIYLETIRSVPLV